MYWSLSELTASPVVTAGVNQCVTWTPLLRTIKDMDEKGVSQHPQYSAKFCLIPAKYCGIFCCFLRARCLGPYLGHLCFPRVPSEIPEGAPGLSVQLANLLINEVNADNPREGEVAEYIELFYTGQTCFDL